MELPSIDPVLPVLRRDVPRGREWRYEVKLDGFRGTLYFDGREGWFRSKGKRRMTRFRFLAAALAEQLRAARIRSVILDGEIVVMGEHGPDFYALMQARQPQYAAFDLLWLNGRDLRPLSYAKRKTALRKLLERIPAITYVEPHTSPALFQAAAEMDLEGIVAKRASDPYDEQTEWVKVKHSGYSQAEGRGDLFHPAGRR